MKAIFRTRTKSEAEAIVNIMSNEFETINFEALLETGSWYYAVVVLEDILLEPLKYFARGVAAALRIREVG